MVKRGPLTRQRLLDPTRMPEEHRSETREYVWRYFSLHADQRLKTFHFYLILVTVVLGGALTFLKDAKTPPAVAAPVSILLPVLSLFFTSSTAATEN
jgi:drug/metabolite transporter (DMT)-like permease